MDALTGLPCRKEAFAQLEVAVNVVRAAGKRMVVAMVDVDRFYRVNETKGTEFGNLLLCKISERLSAARRVATSVSRVGGNRFLVAMPLENDDCHSIQAVEALKNAVERPIDIEGTELYLTSSIGATLFPQDGRTSEQLICRAESALYQSKERGGNQARFYNTEDTIQLNRRIVIEAGLRPALSLRQFRLSYQPVYQMTDGKLRGFEALIRWEHPELGEISPTEFIPIAEHNGLVVPIGEWVIRESCRMLASMSKYGLCNLIMSINVSAQQLQSSTFSQTVLHALKEHGIAPSSFELEIKEDKMIYNSNTAAASLSWLRAAGVRVVLDDFGTGFSSFVNLKHLPVQCLKIDKSFIKKMDLPSAEGIIVEGIITLAHKLGLEVIAEGVEYKEQYELLSEWGCDYVQGFLLGKPKEPDVLDLTMIRRSEYTTS
ncbi:putative bifunctional diguanylate cyclase/phosphodiesterase [Paenibacillus sp. 2TAB23]|uniref:putative bifunctional diguanylate cyclase/phosphodiesterase n=1 Tax=Paenibacillus sp. 2TAB23 TaxID=3233004 RepID=UPI003F9AF349